MFHAADRYEDGTETPILCADTCYWRKAGQIMETLGSRRGPHPTISLLAAYRLFISRMGRR